MTAVVYDLEYTTWEGALGRNWSGPGEHREIVQIGAVRLDEQWREVAALSLLVRPRLNPLLSDYFIRLTGITQIEVNAEGIDFAEAQATWAKFSGPDSLLYSNGTDGEVIIENCRLLGIAPLVTTTRFRNIRPLIGAMAGRQSVDSCDLAAIFGLVETGRGHTALADARAVAATIRLAWERGDFRP